MDNLLDIEVAYSLLRGGSDDSSKDPIDVNYEKLKTDIKVRGLPLPKYSVVHPRAVVPNLCVHQGHLHSLNVQPGLEPVLSHIPMVVVLGAPCKSLLS